MGHPQLPWNIYIYICVYCGGACNGPSPASMGYIYIYTYIHIYIYVYCGGAWNGPSPVSMDFIFALNWPPIMELAFSFCMYISQPLSILICFRWSL